MTRLTNIFDILPMDLIEFIASKLDTRSYIQASFAVSKIGFVDYSRVQNSSFVIYKIEDYNYINSLNIIIKIDLNTKLLSNIVLSNSVILRELSLYNNYITNLEFISNLVNLKYLNLSYNYIKDILPISVLISLQYLHLSDNYIDNIEPISNLVNLKYLDLSSNEIKNIEPISVLVKLNYLYLYNNSITDRIEIENCKIYY